MINDISRKKLGVFPLVQSLVNLQFILTHSEIKSLILLFLYISLRGFVIWKVILPYVRVVVYHVTFVAIGWTWVIEKMLGSGDRLLSTHCTQFTLF